MTQHARTRRSISSYKLAWWVFGGMLALWILIAPATTDGWYDILPVIALMALAYAVVKRARMRLPAGGLDISKLSAQGPTAACGQYAGEEASSASCD